MSNIQKMMKRWNDLGRFIGFLAAFGLCQNVYSNSCPEQAQNFYEKMVQYERLEKQKVELDKRFEALISDEYRNQAEGVITTLQRNEAKKVFFSKKRVTEKVEKLETELEGIQKKFCSKCQALRMDPKLPFKFCDYCLDNPECNKH